MLKLPRLLLFVAYPSRRHTYTFCQARKAIESSADRYPYPQSAREVSDTLNDCELSDKDRMG